MFALRLRHHAFIVAVLCAALFAGCTAALHRQTPELRSVPPNQAKPVVAVAQPWYLIHDEGAKPSRILYYAQAGVGSGYPSPRNANVQMAAADRPRNVNVEIVYESAREADAVYKKLAIDCRRKSYQETMQRTVYRDGRASQEGKSALPQPMTAAWQAQIHRFACGPVAELTIQNGFARLGPIADENLLELSWKIPWQDGTRPPSATTRKPMPMAGNKTAATEQERLQKDAQAGLEAYVEAQAEKMETSRRRAQTPNPRLETWIGATKGQLLQDWGRSNAFKTDENGDDLLTYVYDNSSALVASSSHGPVISSVTRRCLITWQIHRGVVKTYRWKNEAVRHVNVCESMNIGVGPFPENEGTPKANSRPASSPAKRR